MPSLECHGPEAKQARGGSRRSSTAARGNGRRASNVSAEVRCDRAAGQLTIADGLEWCRRKLKELHGMLEKLNDPANVHISKPNQHALKLIETLLEREQQPVLCEVGVGIGATSVAICRLLANRGTYHLFDYSSRLDDLKTDLDGLGFTNVVYHGNSRRKLDSYNWALAQMLLARRAAGGTVPLFDFVFLDGAHAFHHDAPAALLLKDLLKPGGVILFDDYDWSFAISPTMKSRCVSQYPRSL